MVYTPFPDRPLVISIVGGVSEVAMAPGTLPTMFLTGWEGTNVDSTQSNLSISFNIASGRGLRGVIPTGAGLNALVVERWRAVSIYVGGASRVFKL